MTRQTAAHTPDPGRPATPGARACTAGAGTGGFLASLMLALGVGLLVHGLQARPPGLRTFEMGLRDGMTRRLGAVSIFTPQEAATGPAPTTRSNHARAISSPRRIDAAAVIMPHAFGETPT